MNCSPHLVPILTGIPKVCASKTIVLVFLMIALIVLKMFDWTLNWSLSFNYRIQVKDLVSKTAMAVWQERLIAKNQICWTIAVF
jgi:hypothetical protein